MFFNLFFSPRGFNSGFNDFAPFRSGGFRSNPFEDLFGGLNMMFNRMQIPNSGFQRLSGPSRITLQDADDYKSDLEDLMPALSQPNRASDELNEIAEAFGYGNGADLQNQKNIRMGSDRGERIHGFRGDDVINAGMGDDRVWGRGGDDEIQGGYGDDRIYGGAGNDLLDGGHGEDIIRGGSGDDFIISRSDAREPYPTFKPNRAEGDPDGELDPITGKVYADQPVAGDDILTGGSGADTFYFQLVINAKEQFILKHANDDDGEIQWQNVAGENDDLHDHWVDGIGNDTITDFNLEEGDRLFIEGHTTRIADVLHVDLNRDGDVESTVVRLYSEQGNAGAHDNDLLGTITLRNALIEESDIDIARAPTYGIVNDIIDLEEALAPLDQDQNQGFNPFAPQQGGGFGGFNVFGGGNPFGQTDYFGEF